MVSSSFQADWHLVLCLSVECNAFAWKFFFCYRNNFSIEKQRTDTHRERIDSQLYVCMFLMSHDACVFHFKCNMIPFSLKRNCANKITNKKKWRKLTNHIKWTISMRKYWTNSTLKNTRRVINIFLRILFLCNNISF